MPFANLPDTHNSPWGDELTAEKMKECVWLRPEAVAQIEFLEVDGGRPAEAFIWRFAVLEHNHRPHFLGQRPRVQTGDVKLQRASTFVQDTKLKIIFVARISRILSCEEETILLDCAFHNQKTYRRPVMPEKLAPPAVEKC